MKKTRKQHKIEYLKYDYISTILNYFTKCIFTLHYALIQRETLQVSKTTKIMNCLQVLPKVLELYLTLEKGSMMLPH